MNGLSKSRYAAFRTCDKAFWLSVFNPKLAVIDSILACFEVGTEVGEQARGLFGPLEDMSVRKKNTVKSFV